VLADAKVALSPLETLADEFLSGEGPLVHELVDKDERDEAETVLGGERIGGEKDMTGS